MFLKNNITIILNFLAQIPIFSKDFLEKHSLLIFKVITIKI